MRLKTTVSALLTILLLSVSCASPVCAAVCDLKALPLIEIGHNHRDHRSSRGSYDAMTGDHDGMDMGGAENVAKPSQTVSVGDCCHHQVCGHDELAAYTSASYQIEQPSAVLTAMFRFDRTQTLSASPLDLASHSPPLSPPKRNTILRI